MTSCSAPLDLSLAASVRSAEHRQSQQPASDASVQTSSRQQDKAITSRRARRGRRRASSSARGPPPPSDHTICAAEPSTTASRLSRHCEKESLPQSRRPVFAQLDGDCADEDKNKPAPWRMDDSSPVSAASPDDSGTAVLSYGRRGKTGTVLRR